MIRDDYIDVLRLIFENRSSFSYSRRWENAVFSTLFLGKCRFEEVSFVFNKKDIHYKWLIECALTIECYIRQMPE